VGLRAILLDFGGTLVRPRGDIMPIFRVAADRANVAVPWAEFARANDRAWEELWPEAPALVGQLPSFADRVHERALRVVGAKGPIETMVRCIREEAVSPRWHVPYPETEPTLAELTRRGFTVHLVSNNVDYLPQLLENLGWSERLDSVTYSQEIGAAKPDPRLFRLALDRAGCAPEEAVHVGDSWEQDYLGALGAGVRAIWLNRRGRPRPGSCEAVRDLAGVLPLLSSEPSAPPGPSAELGSARRSEGERDRTPRGRSRSGR
jgi:putative hydrolase of the HAD superfamily